MRISRNMFYVNYHSLLFFEKAVQIFKNTSLQYFNSFEILMHIDTNYNIKFFGDQLFK